MLLLVIKQKLRNNELKVKSNKIVNISIGDKKRENI
jgi:hypothetical protein